MNSRAPEILDRMASLADTTRSRILLLLDRHELTVTELCGITQLPQSTVSRHLKALADAGWVTARGEGTSNDYLPPEIPALPSFRLQKAVSEMIVRQGRDYWTGTVHTTNRRVWEHDDKFKEYLRTTRVLGIDMETLTAPKNKNSGRVLCRPCLDWSERRPHIGGALGAALLKVALKEEWVLQDLDSRALEVTKTGRREILTRFGLQVSVDSSST